MYKSYEHEIKRENGDKIIIRVEFSDHRNCFKINYIGIIPKRKRNIQYLKFTDNYDYRVLDSVGRDKYTVEKYLEVVTIEEIKEAMIKAWENMKPVIESKEDLYKMV